MKRTWKEPLWAVAFLVTALLLVSLVSAVLRPQRSGYGGSWDAYRSEPENSIDVLFLGSSYAYCGWNPGVVYGESCLTSYVMAEPMQTPAITYWYLREALKTQSPAVVVLEGSSLFFETYKDYTKLNIGYMPWGVNRIGAILTAAEPELRPGLFCDLYFYHDRWKELDGEMVRAAMTPAAADRNKGYTALDTVYGEAGEGPFYRTPEMTQAEYRQNLDWLRRIAALCRKSECDLIVTINPTCRPYGAEDYETLARDVQSAAPEARFFNWSVSYADVGIEPDQDFYDEGHLNRWGAEAFSVYTGLLLRQMGYTPREQSAKNRAAWLQTAAAWQS